MSDLPQYDTGRPHHNVVMAADVSADLRRVLDLMPDGIVFMDRDWRLTYANDQARRISRIAPDQLNGPTHWELFPATVGTPLQILYHRVMYDRTQEEYEFFYPPLSIWIHVRAVPIDSGMAIFYQDVTEIRRAQDDAAAVTRQLQQVFDVTTDAIASLNREWQYTFLNRRAQELLGPAEDLLGQVVWHRFPGAVYPSSPFVENYYKTMVHGVSTSFEALYPSPLNLWLRLDCQPSPDGIVVFFRDITADKANEAALRDQQAETERQREELEAVYRTAPVGLALFDPKEFRYLRVNDRQSEIVGLPRESIIGRCIEDVVPSDEVPELFRTRVLKGEIVRDYLYETELRTRPGEIRSFNVNYSPIFDENDGIRAISAAVLEVTQLRRAERALMQSEKLAAVGRLASSISHEINNPLEAVTNLLYLVAGDEELAPSLRGYVEMAQEELARVSQIATQTLRFHRQANRPSAVTPAQLVDAVLNLYQGRLVNSGIQVEASYATNRSILCFENDIRQVLNNLIANAIDAMRTGGRLVVRAHNASRDGVAGVRIIIADTGTGMSAETQRRLFEAFYTTKDLNGTGLGLWISKDIVVRHGGALTLRSTQHPRRHGSVFALFLPLGGPGRRS